ncbi:hypothetical protein LNP24_18470 [Klebsiella pneumoniae subsp. pneumoniae]|nr:hypothetical protein [Klebsiella pneumoniae subsp. pneumoniae]
MSPTAPTGPTSATPPTPIITKTTSAQGGINTDFMISGPGITRHGKIDASTMAVYDVAPTLYEFAGIDPNKSLAKSRCCR